MCNPCILTIYLRACFMLFPRASHLVGRLSERLIPDRWFYLLRYAVSHRRLPNLKQPTTLSEKVLWLQMYDRNPLRKLFPDKYASRAYIESCGYGAHLPELLGIYESPLEIDFSSLPNRYVVKCSHGCGFNYIVPDASKLDRGELIALCNQWLSVDYYYYRREWYYKGLPKRVLVEAFIQGEGDRPPWDFKIFLAHGKPFMIVVDADRFSGHRRAIFDVQWKRIPVKYIKPELTAPVERPAQLDAMIEAAIRLSANLAFARVDFYVTENRFYIGEITNFPDGGNLKIGPPEEDERLGREFGSLKKSDLCGRQGYDAQNQLSGEKVVQEGSSSAVEKRLEVHE
ncbi:Conserved hypothetical protein [gamma proteobacterium HdN1]|nr:Conserved hypothetical protein [gamma proteobacterium HdN1]